MTAVWYFAMQRTLHYGTGVVKRVLRKNGEALFRPFGAGLPPGAHFACSYVRVRYDIEKNVHHRREGEIQMHAIGSEVPGEMQDRVERELESGERVLWMEQPVPRFFSPGSTGAFLFGIPWTAFTVFGILSASDFKMPEFSNVGDVFIPLFIIPFLLVGLAMLSAPLWTYRSTRKTVYAITDRRALSIEGGLRSTTVRSYPPERLQEVYRTERRDGRGDVIIAARSWKDSDGDRRTEKLGFMNVRDAKTVEKMLRELGKTALQAKVAEAE